MDKFYEKKNLGIPATLLTVLAYFIGYYLSINYSGLLVAIVFAVVVFSLNFEDRVKAAVKQSYTVGLFFCLIFLGINVLYHLSSLSASIYILNRIFSNFNTYANTIVNIIVIVVYAIFVICTFFNKDLKLSFLLGDGVPKQQPMQPQMPPVYQQPVPSMQQQMYQQPVQPMPVQPMPGQSVPVQPMPMQSVPVMHNPYQSAPVPPVQNIVCPKCQAVNQAGALFCATCGTKL